MLSTRGGQGAGASPNFTPGGGYGPIPYMYLTASLPAMMRTLLAVLCTGVLLLLSACQSAPDEAADGSANDTTAAVTPMADPGLFPVQKDSLWGYIDTTGTLIVEPQFDRAWRFSGSRALIRSGSRYGYIDPAGRTVVEPRFEDAWHFSEGLAPVQIDDQWGFIDTSGTVVVDPRFELAPGVVEEGATDKEFRLARIDGQYGYRDGNGEVVIAPRYDQAWYFAEGLARVRVGDQWGYIDRSGNMVIEAQFAQAWDFNGGLARVQTSEGIGYIDHGGRYVWTPSR